MNRQLNEECTACFGSTTNFKNPLPEPDGTDDSYWLGSALKDY
jgi:hypothetical protein